MEVLELTRQADVPIKKIADTVRNDQALSAKILKTVNSSYYALSKPCSSISQAITFLGLNTVKSLVLGFSLIDALQQPEATNFDFTAYWRRSVYGAAGARHLAMMTRCCDAEGAFLAALLQDIGALASYLALGTKYVDAIAAAEGDHDRSTAAEKAALGFDHSEAGARLAEKWRLPPELVAGIRHHHAAESCPPQHQGMVRCVHLSVLATSCMNHLADASRIEPFAKKANQWFRLQQSQCPEILAAIVTGARELSRLFQLETGAAPDVSVLMAEAEEAKLEHQLNVERETSSLRETAERLHNKTITDTLTGAHNRAHFDAVFGAAFDHSRETGNPLSALFVDADRFKSVNDTLGHQAGDAVLVELAARARAHFQDHAEAVFCRYGGEEFAAILPGFDRVAAARCAEALRARIAAAPFDLTQVCGKLHAVTISVGVATSDAPSAASFPDAESLLRAADRAVYAAKKSGRNCVRIFSPRPATAPPSVPPAPPAPAPPSTAADPSTRVFIIDDDAAMLQLLRSSLQSITGITAFAFASGASAREALRDPSQRPGLILCDLALGDGSGLDIVRSMRKTDGLRTVPVVMLSASDRREDRDAALVAGANAFISKASLGAEPTAAIRQVVNFWTRLAA